LSKFAELAMISHHGDYPSLLLDAMAACAVGSAVFAVVSGDKDGRRRRRRLTY